MDRTPYEQCWLAVRPGVPLDALAIHLATAGQWMAAHGHAPGYCLVDAADGWLPKTRAALQQCPAPLAAVALYEKGHLWYRPILLGSRADDEDLDMVRPYCAL